MSEPLLFQLLDELSSVSISAEGELVQISVGQRTHQLSLVQLALLDQLRGACRAAEGARDQRLLREKRGRQEGAIQASLDGLSAVSLWAYRDAHFGPFLSNGLVGGVEASRWFHYRGLFWGPEVPGDDRGHAFRSVKVSQEEPYDVVVDRAGPWFVLQACEELGIPLYQDPSQVTHLARQIRGRASCVHCQAHLNPWTMTPVFPSDRRRCAAWRRAEPDWTAPAFPPPEPSITIQENRP